MAAGQGISAGPLNRFLVILFNGSLEASEPSDYPSGWRGLIVPTSLNPLLPVCFKGEPFPRCSPVDLLTTIEDVSLPKNLSGSCIVTTRNRSSSTTLMVCRVSTGSGYCNLTVYSDAIAPSPPTTRVDGCNYEVIPARPKARI
jgi:hypothetical protein